MGPFGLNTAAGVNAKKEATASFLSSHPRFDRHAIVSSSGALVDILEAHDVVFAQVAAGLHFNDVQW